MISINQLNLVDLLPESIKHDDQVRAAAEAIDGEMQKVTEAIKKLPLLPSIDDQLEEVVDLLAWQRHVDVYDSEMTLTQKRDVVKKSKIVHKTKGTPFAVEQLVSAAFAQSSVLEWFQYDGDPFKFKLTTTDRIPDTQKLQRLIAAVNKIKNARSRLERITIERENRNNIYLGAAFHQSSNVLIITQSVPDELTEEMNLSFGLARRKSSKIQLFQEVG